MAAVLDAPRVVPDGVAEKAHEILAQHRVLLSGAIPSADDRLVYAYVLGDTQPYVVTASEHRVTCSCTAARLGNDCAHRYAAMVAWAEQADLSG